VFSLVVNPRPEYLTWNLCPLSLLDWLLYFITTGWSVGQWISVAGIPAGLYAVQNMAALTAYQNLDALTFNVLNQTKTLSAALCCYLVMGRGQSGMQVLALLLLLMSALVMEGIVKVEWIFFFWGNLAGTATMGADKGDDDNDDVDGWGARHFTHGVAPILLASFISGLAGALSQKNLQASSGGRNAYLFSMELCAASVLILSASLSLSADGKAIFTRGFFDGWTPTTFIPIATNSVGGIIVGLVTKQAGSVRKGFALIFGILLSGLVQAGLQPEQGITKEQILGGVLAGFSLYLHATNPPSTSAKKTVKRD
jgi:UDP-sugar transporter A1/2/3